MSKYNNILNLFSLTLVLVILFIVMYGCQFRTYKKRIEKFTDRNDDDNDNKDDNENKDDNDKKDDNENKDKRKKNVKKLDENEVYLLEQFINEKFNENDINDLILNGKFTNENLENMIEYIDGISSSKKNKDDKDDNDD